MPMVYGEGKKSFLRLQEEIMKDSDDQSLFLWIDNENNEDTDIHRGLLAGSPDYFAKSGGFVRYGESEHVTPFSITNRDLCITLGLIPLENDIYIAAIDCPVPLSGNGFMGICLKRLSATNRQYARVNAHKLVPIAKRGNLQTIYVRQRFQLSASGRQGVASQYIFHLRKGPEKSLGLDLESLGYELVEIVASPSSSLSRKRSPPPTLMDPKQKRVQLRISQRRLAIGDGPYVRERGREDCRCKVRFNVRVWRRGRRGQRASGTNLCRP